MKSTLLSRCSMKTMGVLGIILLSLSLKGFSQPTFLSTSSAPADNGSSTTSPLTITPPGSPTLQSGDLIVIYAHYRGSSTLSMSAAAGQSWNTATAPAGGSSQTLAVFWCVFNGSWSGTPSVTGGGSGNPLTAVMYAFRPAVAGDSWDVAAGPTNNSATNTTVSITGPGTVPSNSVTMAFWGSVAATTWAASPTGTNWVNTGLSQQVRNTGGSDQSQTAAYNIRATSGTVGNVSQTQSSSQFTRTSIVTFAEVAPPSNDLCANAITISSSPSCTTTPGTLDGATNVSIGSCSASNSDVWYSFTAQSTNPTITIGGTLGTNGRFQVFSGATCGSLSSVHCSTSSSQALSGLTIGSTYYVRVFSSTGSFPSFSICVDDTPPGNDASGSATSLTPATTCSNIAGSLYAASFTAGTPTITGTCVAGSVTSDVWYTFVAPADIVNISLSSVGSNVTGVELLSGSSGSMFSMACGGTSGIPVANVVAGTTYYVRVYTTGAAPTTYANGGFNICISVAPVANDDCSGAVNLNVSANCSKVFGTVSLATASSGVPTGCGVSTSFDVWYKFTATTTNPTITLGDFGSGFTSSSGVPRRVEIYTGNCGSLTSFHCASSNSSTFTISAAATGLPATTIGTTYYIRIFKESGTATGNGKFSICATSGATSNVRVGNSYVNITKNTTGGVVEPGDILEIRFTIWISKSAGITLYNARFVDNLPTKTSMQTGNEIQVITNEGLRYRGYTATDGANDDAGTYKSVRGAGEYNIRLNLGTTGTLPTAPSDNTETSLGGANNLLSTSNPQAGSGLMFATSYRVQVTGSVGDTIQLNGGKFLYRTATTSTSDSMFTGTSYMISISTPLTLCSNSVGINNASEYGGTFGSGGTLNRGADLSFPIAGYTFVNASSAQAINDGQYAIVNNTSPRGGINQSANKKNSCPSGVAPDLLCDNRMFNGYWYINGDHSGTTNANGNNPVAPGTTGGYMLAVNADYVASEAYRQQLTGLCPNTYYEFSAWIKNICPSCGADSTGAQFAGTPTAPNAGYAGVLPNLTFSMDGLDRYSTGQVDAIAENGGWLKKGFVFKTGSTQTTATLSIRNNAQGGGGNDWVMDDISIATCFPSMSYSPTATPSVCSGNTIQIGDTVRSQFSNYTYYVWQRSQDGGSTWSDLTTPQTATPVLSGSQYQYITTFNVPPAYTTPADSGDIYRVYTATTVPNIVNPNCVANDGSAPISLSVLTCGIALKTDLLSFNGNLSNGYGTLSWTTSKETGAFHFELERSDDNVTYTRIYSVGSNNNGNLKNYYSYTDPKLIVGKKWYRLAMVSEQGAKKYSTIIPLNVNPIDFEVDNIVNPFNTQLSFNVTTKRTSKIHVELMDMQGKTVKTSAYLVYAGTNSLQLLNTEYLAPGVYTFRIQNNDHVISKKVVKNK